MDNAIIWARLNVSAKNSKKPVDVFRRPLDNLNKLSDQAKTRNRQTQITNQGLPFQVLEKKEPWSLVKLADGTFGWVLSEEIKPIKNLDYWSKLRLASKEITQITLANSKVQQYLKSLKEVPYLWGGTTKAGMDCSAFVQSLFFRLAKILLPRNSRRQKECGKRVFLKDIQTLDVLFFRHLATDKHHVGIYFDQKIWHFCLDKKGLSSEPLSAMQKRYKHLTTRRLVEFENKQKAKQKNLQDKEILARIKKAENIHVVGISGTEGSAVALFLKKLGLSFTTHDFSEEKGFKRNFLASHFGYPASKKEKILKDLFVSKTQICLRNNYLKNIEKADLIFVSQNWEAYSANRKLKRVFDKNSKIFATITQLYFQLFPGKIIAITGTNGKSTSSKIISEIMKSDSLSARQAKKQSLNKISRQSWFTGNDRRNIQILDQWQKWDKSDWLTVEVSNRQLKFPLGRAPNIGVITNISPNHLNEYNGSFSAYAKGKFSLIAEQTKRETAVLNMDDLSTSKLTKKSKGTVLPYSVQQELAHGIYVDNDWIVEKKRSGIKSKICPLKKIKLLGVHNLSNTLAAIAATRLAGVKQLIIQKVLAKFVGIPQRLELVFEKNGVKFINDSASTTPESTIAAIRSFQQGSLNLIMGGDTKGVDYRDLVKEIQQKKVKPVLVKSPLATILGAAMTKEKIKFEVAGTLQAAVKISVQSARKGECVLLSPAAAWFCYFAKKIPLGGRGFEKFVKIFAR